MSKPTSDGMMMPTPPGVTPNPDGRTTLQNQYLVVTFVTLSLAFIAVSMRVYTRLFVVASLGLDDLIIILAFCVGVAYIAVCVEAMKYGFGKHLWDVRAADMLVYAKLFSPLGITYCWAPALTKISTLLLFHRLNSARNFRIALYCVGFLTLAYSLATTFVIPIACDPSDPSKANCTNAIGTSQSAVNIFTDVVVLILPIPMLRNLQMPVFQKVVLGCVFGIGSLVVVVSVVRLYFNLTYLTAVDNTWYIAKSGILSSVEVNCAVVCNCIVVLKPLLRKVFPSLLSTPKTPNNYKSSQTPGKGFSKISRSKNSAIELSSVEAGTYHEDDGDISGRRIMVTKSYHVQGHNDDSESMENIIEPDRKFPHYHR